MYSVLDGYVCYQVVFFFKQKTAYEMRISDWSSDVCSSDLVQVAPQDVDIGGFQRQQTQLKSSHTEFLRELQTIEQRLQKLASQPVHAGGSSQGGTVAEPSDAAVREINERISIVSSAIEQLKEKTSKLQSTSSTLVTAEIGRAHV